MSRAGFIVSFDGPGVKDGRIDVRNLAPALLSLGRLIDAANITINGEKRSLKVEVRALAVGSFAVHIDAVLIGWDMLKSLLDRPDVEEAKKLLEWLGLFGVTPCATLFVLYRFLAGRRPDKVIPLPENNFIFEIEGRRLVVPFEVMRLYQERSVNKAIGDLIDTISADSVDRIDFLADDQAKGLPMETLTAHDRASFTLAETQPNVVVDSTSKMALSIRTLAFQEGNKWRLFDGQNIITATIEDENFINSVDRNLIRFAKGDILLCEVRTVQKQGTEGLKTEHAVLKVIEHRPAPDQIPLPFSKP